MHLDFDGLKWLIGTLGIAGGWGYDRWNKRSKLAKAKTAAEAALTEAERLAAAQALTIAAKDREIEQLRCINDELRGALSLSGRGVHG